MRRIAAAIALILVATPAFAAMQAKPVEWTVGDDRFRGMLVYDDAGARRPGLVMVPNWMGMSQANIDRARGIAGSDYVILVADLYGAGVLPRDSKEAREQVVKVYSDGGVTLRRRVAAAVDALKAQADAAPLDVEHIAAFGFCFGGSAVLELARSGVQLAGVASVHGDLESYRPAAAGTVRTPVLVLNGAADTSVTPEQIIAFGKEMDAAGADWQFMNFSRARHCFTQPENQPADPADNCRYDERASRRAFTALHAFFRERFSAK